MHITRLELHDFRCYHEWVVEPHHALTVFVGPNAVGKTNIIESIQLIATGTSFRNPDWPEVVRWGSDRALIKMSAEGEGSHADVELRVSSEGAPQWKVGGVPKRRRSDATRFVPVVAFTPDDLLLVKGPAEQRRSAIDALGEQLSATYGALRRDYLRVIRQRNILLREEASSSDIEPWDDQLVTLGARLHVHRRRLVQRVSEAAAPVYRTLAKGEDLSLSVTDRCGTQELDEEERCEAATVERTLAAELQRRRPDERSRKTSVVGPHRDDILFLVNGRDARAYASQGQQRTIALAWKWAEVAVVSDVLRKTPVLLLDDVMSELDETRRRALTGLVQQDVQTFVTTTSTHYFDPALLTASRVITLGADDVPHS